MKIKNIMIVSLFGLTLNAQAQSYNFSVSTSSYSDLAGSTTLNNGMVWDDPQFTIPIGFNFQYFNIIMNQIFIDNDWGLGGSLTSDTDRTGPYALLVAYDADIADRGFEPDTSLSNISYLLEGTPGKQILKIEWKNVGFLGQIDEDFISSDYTNFQVWLYEGSNDIEIRFGPNSISQPDLSFEGETGSSIGLLNFDSDEELIIGEAMFLEGNPASPFLKQISSLDDIKFLSGIIPNGTVYKFSKTLTGISESQNSFVDVSISPNPSNDYFNISFGNLDYTINSVSIVNTKGQNVKEVNYTNDDIDISDLKLGVYFVKINTTAGMITKKLVKK